MKDFLSKKSKKKEEPKELMNVLDLSGKGFDFDLLKKNLENSENSYTSLQLENTKMENNHLIELMMLLRNNTTIKSLNIRNNNFTEFCVFILVHLLQENTKITKIEIEEKYLAIKYPFNNRIEYEYNNYLYLNQLYKEMIYFYYNFALNNERKKVIDNIGIPINDILQQNTKIQEVKKKKKQKDKKYHKQYHNFLK